VELWIPITILAAFMQNLRSALQKHLKGRLSTSGATFSRFAFAAPIAFLYVAGLMVLRGDPIPGADARFLIFMVIGGLGQIAATALLVYLFSFRNFAVGTTFSKTETVQAAIFGLVVLGETVSAEAIVAIAVSLVGVVMISITRSATDPRDVARLWLKPTTLIGLASGAMFGISAVSYRAASLSLDDGDFIIRAAFTLACVTVFQTVVMAVYMRIREPGQIGDVLASWRVSVWVGLAGMTGSAGWFTAMTLQNVAYVRALGQIELLFTLAASYLFFGERGSRTELAGIALVTAGILILLLAR
jgi:drug/metabolite transporter (DMT)-like permease